MTQPAPFFWQRRPVVRFLFLWGITTGVFHPLAIIGMPAGFAGVSFGALLFLLFVVVFLSVPFFEPTVTVNVVLALTFWLPGLVLLSLSSGSAPRTSDVASLGILALGHAMLQGLVALAVSAARHYGRKRQVATGPPGDPRPKDDLVDEFERLGCVTVTVGSEFDSIMIYVRANHIPTWTHLNRDEGTVTLHERPLGSLEGLG